MYIPKYVITCIPQNTFDIQNEQGNVSVTISDNHLWKPTHT